jgi:hypothetical protein
MKVCCSCSRGCRMAAKSTRPMTAERLRKLSPRKRDALLKAAARVAAKDYRHDKRLTAFEAFGKDDIHGESASAETG